MDVPVDCRRCGACCFSQSAHHVPLTGDDWARLGPLADTLAQFASHRAFMRMAGNHCAALRVTDRSDGARDFFCTAYDVRPQICRELDRLSPACAGERLSKGPLLRVLLPFEDRPKRADKD